MSFGLFFKIRKISEPKFQMLPVHAILADLASSIPVGHFDRHFLPEMRSENEADVVAECGGV